VLQGWKVTLVDNPERDYQGCHFGGRIHQHLPKNGKDCAEVLNEPRCISRSNALHLREDAFSRRVFPQTLSSHMRDLRNPYSCVLAQQLASGT
jgi:hypothetical protein